MKSAYYYIQKTIQNNRKDSEGKKLNTLRASQINKQNTVVRIERPTNIAAARFNNYKSKYGVIVVRTKVRKGTFRKRQIKSGRRPKRKGINRIAVDLSLATIAEQRANRKYPNHEVVNSYYIGKTGKQEFYETIMVNPTNSAITKDKNLSEIGSIKGRVWRGLTPSKRKTNN